MDELIIQHTSCRSVSALQPGDRISHFEIEGLIGRGGMGVVYKARDVELDRTVALKFLTGYSATDQKARARFELEARAASALDHPNICSIFEIGDVGDGSRFIAMAYYDGESLDARLERGALSLEEVQNVVGQITSGLQAAHDRGIIHRDIKPANVIITRKSEVKILDFGLAKMENLAFTGEGRTLGTVKFMSPEQLRGDPIDHRSDIWALGVLIYQLISGREPFAGEYAQAVAYNIVNSEPEELVEAPQRIRSVVSKCLSKEPDDRFQSADEVALALAEEEWGQQERSGDLKAIVERSPISTWVAWIGGMVGLVAVIAVVLFGFGELDGPRLPEAKHIAVLPFVNVGQDQQNQAYVDGLVHAVSSKIAAMERYQGSLWVVPATDVYRKNVTTTDQASKELHVNLAITGSVWIAGEILQLTLNLVDAASGRLLRTAVLEESQSNVIQIQDGVVRTVAGLIDVELMPDNETVLTAGGTSVPGAYQFYLQGLGYLSSFENEADIRRAIELFRRAVEADSVYALGYAGLGEAYWRSYSLSSHASQADSAVAYSEKALALNDRLAEVHSTIGFVYRGKGQYEKAEAAFEEALRIDPANASAQENLGRVYELTGRFDEAEAAYKRAVLLKPDYWDYYNQLGIFYHNRGRHEKAAEQFRQVTLLAPDNPWGFNNLAVQYQRMGNAEAAKPLYWQAAKANPAASGPTALAYYNLAYLEYADDDFAEAADLYERALEYNPRSMDALEGLGTARFELGQTEGAHQAWRQTIERSREILRVNPRDSEELRRTGMVYAMLGRSDSAIVYLNRLLDLPGLSSSDYLAAGKTYEILGDRQRAITYVVRALDLGHSWTSVEKSTWLDELRRDPDFVTLSRTNPPDS